MLGPHTITRLQAALVTDPYSGEDTLADWDGPDNPPTETTIAGCSVQPGAATPELVDQANREGVVIQLTAFVPGGDISESDRVRWQGDDYEISATIQRWDFPPLTHLVVPLKRVEG